MIYILISFSLCIAEQLLWLRRWLRRRKNRIGSRYTDTSGSRFVPSTYVLHTVVKTSNTWDETKSLDRSVSGLLYLGANVLLYLAPPPCEKSPRNNSLFLSFYFMIIYIHIYLCTFFVRLSATLFLFHLFTFNPSSFIFLSSITFRMYVRQPRILAIKYNKLYNLKLTH